MPSAGARAHDTAALPEILEVIPHADGVLARLMISPKLGFFQGHFPGYHLVPGVVQVGWAVSLAALHLPVCGGVTTLERLKFMRPILPSMEVHLRLVQQRGPVVQFSYTHAEHVCASGRLIYGA